MRIRATIAAGVACVALAGCSSRAEQLQKDLDSWTGRTISEVAVRLGPPIASFDVGPNEKAFQWYKSGSYNTAAMAMPIYGTRNVMVAPSQQVQTECRLTMTASTTSKTPGLNDWIIHRWDYSGTAC